MPVGAEGHAGYRVHRPSKREDLLSRDEIPEPDGVVPGAGGKPPAIRAECDVLDLVGVSAQAVKLTPRGDVPQLDQHPSGSGETAAVGAE